MRDNVDQNAKSVAIRNAQKKAMEEERKKQVSIYMKTQKYH